MSVHVWYDKEKVELLGDSLGSYQHQSDESGAHIGVHFCQNCSSTIYLTLERMPKVSIVTGGTLDDPNSIDFNAHVWMRSAQKWMAPPLEGECFETSSRAWRQYESQFTEKHN